MSYRGTIKPDEEKYCFDDTTVEDEEIEENTGSLTNMFLAQSAIDSLKSVRFPSKVSFSSRQWNLIKTFQIEAMIALITKMDFFS